MKTFFEDPNYQYLTAQDTAKAGDIYDLAPGRVAVIGTKDTFQKAGEKISEQILCYHPRRKKKLFGDT